MFLLVIVAATAWGAKKPKKLVSRHAKPPASAPAPKAAAQPSVPAPPTWSPEEYERRKEVRQLVVVGVYRPVEMEGRTVAVPREVYLQVTDGQGKKVEELRGRALEVYRKVPVPAAVPAVLPTAAARAVPSTSPVSATAAPAAPVVSTSPPATASAAPAPITAPPTAAPPQTASSAVARLRALKKAQEQVRAGGAAPSAAPSASPPGGATTVAETAGGPPASAAPPSAPALGSETAPRPIVTTAAPGSRDSAARGDISRPRPQALETTEMEVVIGRLQVVEIRGQVVVARVADDGVGKPTPSAPETVAAELPAIMAGDLARFVIAPPPPPVPPPPAPPPALTREEQARLDAERKRAEGERWRRKHPRGQYERKVMKWKL